MGENKRSDGHHGVEVKEFVSGSTSADIRRRAARAKYSYEKRSVSALLQQLAHRPSVAALTVFAAAAVAVILFGIAGYKISVVVVCVLVLLETLLASCLHNLPVWVHGLVGLVQVVTGIVISIGWFTVCLFVLYIAAVFALKYLILERE